MNYCANCGNQNGHNVKFCGSCGAPQKSTPSQPKSVMPPTNQQPNTILTVKGADTGVIGWVYNKVFVDKCPDSLAKSFLILLAADSIISVFLESALWPKTSDSIETSYYLGGLAVFYLIFYALIKTSLIKSNKNFLWPLLILYAAGFFYLFDSETQQRLAYLISNFPFWGGGLPAVFTARILGIWDLCIGTMLEFVLLIRLFQNIKK